MNFPNKALKTRAFVRDYDNPSHSDKIGIHGTIIPQPEKNRSILCYWDGVWKYGSLPILRFNTTPWNLKPGQVTSLWPDAWHVWQLHKELQKHKTKLENGLHIVYMDETEFYNFLETVQNMDGPQLAALRKKHAKHNPAAYIK
jgi:hypothetical protein